MKHIVGFSGGIDSQACARWVLNRHAAKDVVLINSDAGGNEHPMTTEHIHWYSANVHPVVMLTPIVGDMGGIAKAKRADLGWEDSKTMTFDMLATLKGRWPSSQAQFCTEYLKLLPQKRWITENVKGEKFVRYSGVRRDESKRRTQTSCIEAWDDYFECGLHCPLADWTKQMCFDYVKSHGEKVNPLYALGFSRVGCAPCINSNKSDIRMWAQRFPAMIDKVRGWEATTGRTFFSPMVPGKEINWIDEVVAWSMTERGGVQLTLLMPLTQCETKYSGLCE